ncbi:NADPH-dependent assimilatory sulfite reductase hemoprotein subunit [Mariniblastus fucicola]|uniref:Sulfite reductase [NADPH] hemoprotein beta-component n=1 Tax=Mariniblastus fucicola TaxID=980251 RepID=A0A5B9PFX4_9BACT|nr:NADPH-dependent assimilatory sulfite reductase hemoprotein subunit [Mariniblastus fucicola]QEG24479.1 Sulfite reductase [NADPH] hemoprotein beta-component [Mariniblastus fucicola]
MAKDKNAPSKVEKAKVAGKLLRGTIDEVLRDESQDSFEHDDLQLLKFHGTYQQDDRDLRAERRKEGLGKAYSFMIRVALPGGVVSNSQYLDLDRMADEFANGSIRITTRQAVQFHGVVKDELRETMRQINASMMTTLAACGDVCRNVMASAAPFTDEVYTQIRKTTEEIAVDLRPATKAYYELWIDGQKQDIPKETEPFYGETYLPRKYKVGVTLAGENQIDVYSYDAGLVGFTEDGKLTGYNVVAGGGLGMSHGRPNTFARIADEIGFVAVENGVEAIRIVCAIYRDFGNRNDRKQARLKYLVNEKGVDWFREEFAKRASFDIQPPKVMPTIGIEDWLGPHKQNDDLWFYGVFVENGRIIDNDRTRCRSAFRKIAKEIGCDAVFTAQQSIIFSNLKESQVAELEAILKEFDVPTVDTLSNAKRYSMACPAMPTCGLAVAESERVSHDVVGAIETKLAELGLADVPLTIRMTGCPNGCARPYTADIAFVGRRPGVYHLFVGGRLTGDRMADLFAGDVKIEDAIEVLTPLLSKFAADRKENEGLGDFYQRILERDTPRKLVTGKEEQTLDAVAPLVQIG